MSAFTHSGDPLNPWEDERPEGWDRSCGCATTVHPLNTECPRPAFRALADNLTATRDDRADLAERLTAVRRLADRADERVILTGWVRTRDLRQALLRADWRDGEAGRG